MRVGGTAVVLETIHLLGQLTDRRASGFQLLVLRCEEPFEDGDSVRGVTLGGLSVVMSVGLEPLVLAIEQPQPGVAPPEARCGA